MNKVELIGRLSKDPETRYSQGDNSTCICSYTLAVPRKYPHQDTADFIQCKAFGKMGEVADRFYKKGVKVAVVGRIQTGSYTNRDGNKVYTTEVVVEDQEFAESKNAQQQAQPQGYQQYQQYAPQPTPQPAPQPGPQTTQTNYGQQQYQQATMTDYAPPNPQTFYQSAPNNAQNESLDGFMSIPEGITEDLPFQ